MARHALKSQDSEGFLRAFHDTVRDLEGNHYVRVYITLELTKRRGVLRAVLRAYEAGENETPYPQAKYSVEYPTAQVGSFEAALYQASIKLDHILTQQKLWPMGKA